MSCISREKKFQLGNLEHWTVPRHTKSETHCTHNAFCSEYMGGGKIQMPNIQMQEKASTWIDLTLFWNRLHSIIGIARWKGRGTHDCEILRDKNSREVDVRRKVGKLDRNHSIKKNSKLYSFGLQVRTSTTVAQESRGESRLQRSNPEHGSSRDWQCRGRLISEAVDAHPAFVLSWSLTWTKQWWEKLMRDVGGQCPYGWQQAAGSCHDFRVHYHHCGLCTRKCILKGWTDPLLFPENFLCCSLFIKSYPMPCGI